MTLLNSSPDSSPARSDALDAAHSGIDLLGAGLTLFSVRISGKPADEDHTYGHGKIENLSAFVETGLMVISCIWIIYEAIDRIVFHQHLALNLSSGRSRGSPLHRRRPQALPPTPSVARRHRTAALEPTPSTSLPTSGLPSLFSSASRCLVRRIPYITALHADPVAAIVVSILIARLSWSSPARPSNLSSTPRRPKPAPDPQT